jgi:hypothetical protein
VVVGSDALGDLLVPDRQVEAVTERAELLLRELLHLVRDVAALEGLPERPPLDRLGEDDDGSALELDRGRVRGVELAVVVATAA